MIKLLIFDLDGTLFHTGPGIHEAVNVLFDRYQLPRPTYDKVISFIGGGLHNFMTHIGQETAHMKLDFPTLETEFRAIYGDLFRSAELFSGVEDFLSGWNGRLAVVSNKDDYYVRELVYGSPLKRFDWSRVIGGNTLPYKKPHPEPLLDACRASGVDPHEALMIGDGLPDVEGAKNAGIKSVAISFGYTPISELIQSGAHAVLNDYCELQRIVSTFGGDDV